VKSQSTAERGMTLMDQYNLLHTNDEEHTVPSAGSQELHTPVSRQEQVHTDAVTAILSHGIIVYFRMLINLY